MSVVEWLALAFLAGVTLYGMIGTALELMSGAKLSFAPPFATWRNPARLLTAPALAGPMMLFNDALDARRDGRISTAQFMACAATCLVWTGAMGVIILELLSMVL